MARIVNLGSPGAQRESSLSGFASTFSAVSGARENRARTGIMQQEADTRGQESSNRSTQLKADLLKVEREEQEEKRKLASETQEALSIRLAGKTQAEQDLLLDSPPFKDLAKTLFKDSLPEAYDADTQRIVILDRKWIPKTREELLAFKEDAEKVLVKVRAGAPLSSSDLVVRERSIIMSKGMGMISQEEFEAKMKDVSERMAKLDKGQDELMDRTPKVEPNDLTDALGGTDLDTGGINQEWWNQRSG